jgi:hypothetical protein
MTKTIYILVGTPGSGKTWIAKQLIDRFTFVPHDSYKTPNTYVEAIRLEATRSNKPILCETPFTLSFYTDSLSGFEVKPIFIIETPEVTQGRYESRFRETGHGQPIMPKGHLTRIDTYHKRAHELGAPMGTSSAMLDYLKKV